VKHASFFSGVGGLDLGFERAGIETVSVSEIDPYANSVLAERFPDAPNLGSITEVKADDIPEADIWSGGFPCQDLSVAGKRAGFAGKRSSLAFTFLDLVEQRRPRWLVLENVPGLFSSNGGADFGRLLYEMEQLRYGVSWRTLDARYFGVAQRRRRVFLVASLESDRAGEVLFECEGCERHPAPSWSQRQSLAGGTPDGSGINQHRTASGSSPSPDSDGVRAPDGLARRLDNQQSVERFTSTPAHGEKYADTLAARDWKGGVANQDIKRRGWLAIVRESNFGGYAEDETGATLRAQGGNYGGGSENLAMTGYQTRADEKNGNFSITEAEVANSLSALWPGDTSHRSMPLVQAVIQDSREMANKTQNGAGFSTEDISYPLTGVDRQAVATEPILSFPSRFGSNANVTEDQAKSMAHSAGAPAVFRKSARAQTNDDSETWVEGDVANTLNSFDVGDVRTTHAVVAPTFYERHDQDGRMREINISPTLSSKSDNSVDLPHIMGRFTINENDPLLPLGLDSHRYRCCGNGVVAPVAEWIGRRIVEVDRRWREEVK
jgi:DNA (cytosine-5)-methyltransferase 1